MSIPVSEVNVIGTHMYSGTDLGLSSSLTSAQTSTSTTVHTGAPCWIVVLSQLSSGSGNIKIDIASTAAAIDFSSPTKTLAASGTGQQVAVVETTSSEMFVGVKLEPGVSGMAFDTGAGKLGLSVFALYERKKGQEWFNVADSLNMILSSLNTCSDSTNGNYGDNSGVPSNAFTKPAKFI